ncbi:MAG: DUF1016 family protein [Spirochaetaceae bacterium]|nr:DUF1016 family protein [Spirochaetaceae bacterium]
MAKKNSIKLFEDRLVRSVWDDERGEWYFSINDVVQILTDSINVTDYIKKMRKRDEELGQGWGQIVTPLSVETAGGRQKTNFADTKGIFRIIQSIPSKKAEPFKQWLAKVGAERLDQLQDPELSIKQGLEDYRRLGYSDDWINQRLKSIEIRKDLTDQWKEHNVEEGVQYAALTDIIYQAWVGKTAKEYKKFKGLKKENLRDNMTNEELVLNMLAELSATSITKAKNPQTLEENARCAHEGGNVAAVARRELESKTGRSIVTPLNAKDYFAAQIEAKKEQLYLSVRNFILGTGLAFGFSNEKLRVFYKDSYFYIDQIYYHIPSRRNVLLKICRKPLTITEKKQFKEQISFYDTMNRHDGENEAVGMLFIISEKKIQIEYIVPDVIGKAAQELGLPASEVFDSFLQKSLADLRMN